MSVDRCKTCPFLVRTFIHTGPRRSDDYRILATSSRRGDLDEVAMYTWRDATLRELADLVRQVRPQARQKGARLAFALVFPDARGRHVMRPVGEVPSSSDARTLDSLRFEIGDFLDVTVLPCDRR